MDWNIWLQNYMKNKKTEIRESIFVSQKAEERRILWVIRRVLVLDSEDGF